MANIVGSEATQQRGVLHRQSDMKFDQDLTEFKALWDTRQREAEGGMQHKQRQQGRCLGLK